MEKNEEARKNNAHTHTIQSTTTTITTTAILIIVKTNEQ